MKIYPGRPSQQHLLRYSGFHYVLELDPSPSNNEGVTMILAPHDGAVGILVNLADDQREIQVAEPNDEEIDEDDF